MDDIEAFASKNWKFELEEYIKQGEPSQAEKSAAWKIAIGLQAVDGLKTSQYLLETAKEHIEGKITIETAQKRIENYYKHADNIKAGDEDCMEADIVASRIAKLLGEESFHFSPIEYKDVHRRLFLGVFEHAGQYRTYNITKKEWVLKGGTVLYAPYNTISATLEYDFKNEKDFDYTDLSAEDSVKHFAKFTSGIWQIHPFCEGNTRATAVFIIKYLRTFGFNVSNDMFAENSWYFRNALVRANYSDVQNNIPSTTIYLERFFGNLLLGRHYLLKNRYMHLDAPSDIQSDISSSQSDKNSLQSDISNPQSDIQSDRQKFIDAMSRTSQVSFSDFAILKPLVENPTITQAELAELLAKTVRTIKRKMKILQEKGMIERVNGKRNGVWKITIDMNL